MSYAISQRTSLKPSDGRWLLLAVLLHLAVFLIPLRDLPPGTITQSAELVVRLVMGEPTVTSQDVPEKVFPDAEPVREVLEPRPGVAKILELEARDKTPEPKPEVPAEVTTARLMGLRDSLTSQVPLTDQSNGKSVQLGEQRAYTPPENWQPHAGAEALAPFDNQFNGMATPENVEIVDRWVATDGSHNVIVETPGGLRLCGRARPSDPMRPYVENVMSFHICGGDGAIPFKFKPREPLDRNFIVPMAKDANEP